MYNPHWKRDIFSVIDVSLEQYLLKLLLQFVSIKELCFLVLSWIPWYNPNTSQLSLYVSLPNLPNEKTSQYYTFQDFLQLFCEFRIPRWRAMPVYIYNGMHFSKDGGNGIVVQSKRGDAIFNEDGFCDKKWQDHAWLNPHRELGEIFRTWRISSRNF